MLDEEVQWDSKVGCRYLVQVGIQWRCSIFLNAGPMKRAAMTEDMGIGFGCSSTLFNTEREEMIQRLRAAEKGGS